MSSRTYLQLQQELANSSLDTSTDWAAGGTKNKLAVSNAYEHVYDLVKNSGKVKPYIATAKASLTITNKVGALPVGFDVMNIVSLVDFATEADVEMNCSRYYRWQVRGAL